MKYMERRVKTMKNEEEKVRLRNDLTTKLVGLRKTFWVSCRQKIRAINNLYLGLEANEKFGLLGYNGSGKTTTFKAITNEIEEMLFYLEKITKQILKQQEI